jgi:hypothetical protein
VTVTLPDEIVRGVTGGVGGRSRGGGGVFTRGHGAVVVFLSRFSSTGGATLAAAVRGGSAVLSSL